MIVRVRSAVGALAVAAVIVGLAAGCGRKGDPRPPLRPVPGPLTEISARRVDDRVELRFRLPAANADNTTPSVLERVEIYALAAPAGTMQPTPAQIALPANLETRIEVRPGADARPAPGDEASYLDTTITDAISPTAPTVYYLLVQIAGRQRRAMGPIAVPLSVQLAAPHTTTASHDERTVTVGWQPGAASQSFRVYEVDARGQSIGPPPTGAPLTTPTFTTPVEFEKPRCFVVRAVQVTGPVTIESAATPPACVTPVDTFPPAAPADLRLFPGAGSITLTWSAVEAADLASYIVLRGEGTGDTLQPLGDPVTSTTFTDRQVRAGVTYWYAVRAVDSSPRKNQSINSNRQQATAR